MIRRYQGSSITLFPISVTPVEIRSGFGDLFKISASLGEMHIVTIERVVPGNRPALLQEEI